MVRFLTPSKITTLVLATIYVQGAIPFSGTSKVLNFLIDKTLLNVDQLTETQDDLSEEKISVFETVLADVPSVVTGRSVWDLLLKHLWTIDCNHALDNFISAIPALLAKDRVTLLKERDEGLPPDSTGKIIRTSPLGVFIRKCFLEFTQLQFHNSVAIWLDFVVYRSPTKAAHDKRNPGQRKNALDVNLTDLKIDGASDLVAIMFRPLLDKIETQQEVYSTHDVEKLMEFQVSEMQSIGGRLPGSMRKALKQMSMGSTSIPKVSHYLKFLDSWRAGDYVSAFDSLHRYFDYTMQNRERTYYQYALLNLAILQADFGCHHEAIPAMQEAISTARENRDTICLNYCMSWLYHFGRAFPSQMQAVKSTGVLGDEHESLQFLKARAKEAEMWTLLSTSWLSEAKLALQQGDSVATIFEHVVKASHVVTTKNVAHAAGPSLLMKSTIFSRIGQAHLAWSSNDRFFSCHTEHAPLEDILKTTVRQANLLASAGRYTEGRTLLLNIEPSVLHVLKYRTYHTLHLQVLHARRLLQHSQLTSATDLVSQLLSQHLQVGSEMTTADIDTTFTLAFLNIDLLMRKGQLAAASDALSLLATRILQDNPDIMLQCKVQITQAQIWAQTGKPMKGFSLVLKAMETAYRVRAMPAVFEAVLAFSKILLVAHEFVAARDLVRAILPAVLECLDCDLAGRTYEALADGCMGMAGQEGRNPSSAEEQEQLKEGEDVKQPSRHRTDATPSFEMASATQKELVEQAMEYLGQALEQFGFVEDLQGQLGVIAKMARIHLWREDVELAAEMGDRWVELKKDYAEKKD